MRGRENGQQLEIRADDCVNSITTVQKDNIVLEGYKQTMPLNPMSDDTCRTIKNQYAKNSADNFESQGTFGASGVVYIRQATKQGTMSQSCLQSMWETYEGEGVLRKALSEIQKIWESDGSDEAEWYLIRIRKLTARECWRLMGFTDEDFDKAEQVCSNTQLYKQAGNSICVPVIEAIIGQML